MAIARYHVVSPRLRGELDLFGEVGLVAAPLLPMTNNL
jgi:hypothetical protein